MTIKPTYQELEKENEILRKKLQIGKMNEKFDTYFEQNKVIMLQIHAKTKKIINANKPAIDFYGYTKNELLQKKISDLNILPPNEIDKLMKKAMKNKSNFFQFQHKLANGKIKDVEIYSSSIKSENEFSMIVTVYDITARKKAERKVILEKNRFQKTLDAIDAIVYVADMQTYELLFFNKYAKDLFGDKIGNKCYSVLQKGRTSPCKFCTNHLLLDKNNKPNEPYVWVFKNTLTDKWYQCRDQAIEWTDNRLVRIEIATDINDRKIAEQALKESETKLRESNATKDKFFSIIAHDLKSPFNSMLGFSEMLNSKFDEYDTKKQKKFIGVIYTSLQSTYKLLENLLFWSRSQSGRIDFKPEKINLFLMSKEASELLQQTAENKAIKLFNQIPKNIFVDADKDMLLTIIRNLLSNALKFTHKGGEITINSNLITTDKEQSFVKISVTDSGVGIPPEIQNKLFDIGENTSTKGTENETGTGLGLILCKEFVEKHGGKIWVESEIDKGSSFSFKIPYKSETINIGKE